MYSLGGSLQEQEGGGGFNDIEAISLCLPDVNRLAWLVGIIGQSAEVIPTSKMATASSKCT